MHSYKAKEYFGQGDECNYLFDFEGSTRILAYLFDNDEQQLKDVLSRYKELPKGTDWIYFLSSHDTINLELVSQKTKDYLLNKLDPEGRFIKTHDKRLALRISEIFNGDAGKIAYAFNTLFSLPGIKTIYYGDEIGMPNTKTGDFIIDNRFEVRGYFDWEELEKQKSYQYSVYNRVKNIIHTSLHQEQKSL
jgi:glycosidase